MGFANSNYLEYVPATIQSRMRLIYISLARSAVGHAHLVIKEVLFTVIFWPIKPMENCLGDPTIGADT